MQLAIPVIAILQDHLDVPSILISSACSIESMCVSGSTLNVVLRDVSQPPETTRYTEYNTTSTRRPFSGSHVVASNPHHSQQHTNGNRTSFTNHFTCSTLVVSCANGEDVTFGWTD